MRIGTIVHVSVTNVVLATSASAFISSIGPGDADRALRIARSPLAQREAFSSRYNLDLSAPTVNGATLQRLEILTEFRRMERTAEERLGVDPTFGAGGTDEMIEAIRPWRYQLALVAHLRLGSVLLGATPPPTAVLIDDQRPMNLRVRTLGGGEGPPTGAEVEAIFDSTRITSAVHTISVRSSGVEVATRSVDFRRFE